MKRLYTLLLFAFLSMAGAMAQDMGSGFVSNGYYRIRNVGSQRYLYVTDNKDYYNMAKDEEDFQAIQLWKESGRDFISDPGSIIYIKQVGSQFDLEAQGTGVHQLTGYYVGVDKQSDGSYIVSASVSKAGMQVTKYLTDNEKSGKPQGKMGTSGTLNFRKWIVDQISTTHATNYFGLKPEIEVEDKFYQSFYAAFPFRVTSEEMHVYTVSKVAGSKASLTELTGDIPAGTPVIIECDSNDPAKNRLELLPPAGGKVDGNLLTGNFFCNGKRPEKSVDAFTLFQPATMRVLAVKNGKLTFSNSVTDTPSLTKINIMIDWSNYVDSDELCIAANSAYLKVAEDCAADLTVLFGEEEEEEEYEEADQDVDDEKTVYVEMKKDSWSTEDGKLTYNDVEHGVRIASESEGAAMTEEGGIAASQGSQLNMDFAGTVVKITFSIPAGIDLATVTANVGSIKITKAPASVRRNAPGIARQVVWTSEVPQKSVTFNIGSPEDSPAKTFTFTNVRVQFAESTPIGKINADDADTDIYDLQGRKLYSMQKGINIMGGKKYIVK